MSRMRINFQELKLRIRLKDLLDKLAWKPTEGRGAQLRGPCPLPACQASAVSEPSASRARSFSVNTERNIFRCFRCGSSGNVLDFWQHYRGITIHAAAQELTAALAPESVNSTTAPHQP